MSFQKENKGILITEDTRKKAGRLTLESHFPGVKFPILGNKKFTLGVHCVKIIIEPKPAQKIIHIKDNNTKC